MILKKAWLTHQQMIRKKRIDQGQEFTSKEINTLDECLNQKNFRFVKDKM